MSEQDQYIVGPHVRPVALVVYGLVVAAALIAQTALAVYITSMVSDVRSDVAIIRDTDVKERLDGSRNQPRRDGQVGDEDGD